MKLIKYCSIGLTTLLLLFLGHLCFDDVQAQASYYSSLKNSSIQITTPNSSSISCQDSLLIEGSSNLKEIWFGIRGPQQELSLWKAQVKEGIFSTTINLRFGSGQYTIWAGADPHRFDGTIRFLVHNQSVTDNRYMVASIYVDSHQSEIIDLAAAIAPEGMSGREKAESIHSWITQNIKYDYEAYLNQDVHLRQASQILKEGKGLCRDFSFLFAALARAAQLPAKVVYGQAETDSNWEMHAWNEVMIDGQWVAVDSSWDAGYIKGKSFVQAPSRKYLAPDAKTFALTHRLTQTTVH
ncbi:MAG: transglutaminase domain-containing protein [Syntrophomonadaceae bacterium]|jgi:hypothetical protein|nr:transglutaminase domain-containing protein [Syntrophomonadaceae bacterium]